jgi:hypothetical protein
MFYSVAAFRMDMDTKREVLSIFRLESLVFNRDGVNVDITLANNKAFAEHIGRHLLSTGRDDRSHGIDVRKYIQNESIEKKTSHGDKR